MNPQSQSERNSHILFYAALLTKLGIACLQVIGGVAAYLVSVGSSSFAHFFSQQTILNLVTTITQEELTEDARDFWANYLLHFVQNFSMNTLHFVAFYLIVHGLIKLWLIVGLLRRKLWYYPVSIFVFCLFMMYQMYRFTFTHSAFLVLLTIMDAVVIGLTWHEYTHLRFTEVKEQI